jgi:hypothetical protein
MYRILFRAAVVAFCLMSSVAWADSQTGDWVTGTASDGNLFAGVMNESGSMLMKTCNPTTGMCYWILIAATPCNGQTSPALFNAEAGSSTHTVSCIGPASGKGLLMYRYAIGDPDDIDALIASKTPIGIAVALESGRFQVFRFSMKGGSTAISILTQAMTRTKSAPSKGTRDTYL